MSTGTIFPATVVGVLGDFCVVINRGARDGVEKGQRFLLFGFGSTEASDPGMRKSSEQIKIQKGSGSVVQLDDRMATVVSEGSPFHEPKIGDKVRPI